MRTILIIGTADTKEEELAYLQAEINAAGGNGIIMDVGVIGDAQSFVPEVTKHQVAEAIGMTNEAVVALGDENSAMIKHAEGAAIIAAQLAVEGEIDGMLAIGGTMATDLALDVANALPLGFPKMIVSTVAHSHLLPAERIPMDVMMSLWVAGLYGLNSICKTVLRQAAMAVLGATKVGGLISSDRPIVGISSLGTSSLKYIKELYPALQQRGYEVAVFHTTGMGGKAMESANEQGKLCAILDLSLIEVSNEANGSIVSSGTTRLQGYEGDQTPRIMAAGGVTLVDYQAWGEAPIILNDRDVHQHNRLIACAALTPKERVKSAQLIAERANANSSPYKTFVICQQGIDEWDKAGGPFHDDVGLADFNAALQLALNDSVEVVQADCHINDSAFSQIVLAQFDQWVSAGVISSSP